ncbi:MAG: repressor LexA [Alkaliphilus sp.]|nr:transcriptional repressor LexA [Alkaliphilus sp. AH-315-G20]PHS35986.1 MAG: repressor LexA [Alkaliphilus sp.]
MYEDISVKQLQVLDCIKKHLTEKGYPPAVREICKEVNLSSTSTVHNHLTKLEKKGYIRRDPAKPRAIEILKLNSSFDVPNTREIINVPIIGRVTAGEPILATENIEDTFPLPIDYADFGNSNIFMLTIKGSSMINAGILDGDYIIVKQQSIAANGEIVVALIEDEATVKRFFKEKNHIRLQPENDFMQPIIVKKASILGKVIGVFRKIV